MKPFYPLLLFCLLLPTRAASQQTPPRDEGTSWTVGITAFEGRLLDRENSYLTHSFPLMLRERLEIIPSHFFGEEERLQHRRKIIAGEQRRLATQLAGQRRQRDELFFTSRDSEAQIEAHDARIDSFRQRLVYLKELAPAQVAFPDSKPLSFKSGGEGALIWKGPVLSPRQLAAQEEVDLLIWGSFEEIQDYLYFEVRAYDAAMEREVFSYTDAATAQEIYEAVDPLVDALAGLLWGRDWASLSIETEPAAALVWIDDHYQGRAPLQIPYLLPGEKRLRLEAPGYEPRLLQIRLDPFQAHAERLTLVPRALQTFRLDSQPSEAQVYLGSSWLGATPLEVVVPDTLTRLLLRKEGYLDLPVYAGPGLSAPLSLSLTEDSVDLQALRREERNKFYSSFGIFALSLPLPLFFWTYRIDYWIAADIAYYIYGNVDEANRLYELRNTYTYAFAGALAVSSVLFVNMMVKLIRYIRSADRKA